MAELRLPVSVLDAIAQGAEAVDRGARDLRAEIALLAEAGVVTGMAPVSAAPAAWPAAVHAVDVERILMAVGEASLPLGRLLEGHVDALGIVARLGTADAQWLAARAAHRGELLGVWGADMPDSPVRVTFDGSTARLQGSKAFASGLGVVGLAVVTARCPEGHCHAMLVDVGDVARHDADAWDMDGMVGTRSGTMRLDGMTVPAIHWLGAGDAMFAEPHFHGGLWRIAAVQAGALQAVASGLADIISARPADAVQQHRLGQVIVEATSARLWAETARAGVAAGAADAIERVLLAGEAVEGAALRALDIADRAAGTMMHRRDNRLGRVARDLRLYLRQARLDAKLAWATELWTGRWRKARAAAADTGGFAVKAVARIPAMEQAAVARIG
ncbi:hypothetical protein [Sandaracinobacteroides saxicola]|uniref:Acyl-CoA dehydrogenase n=1 Tax=Sandaracinobacteroides saxicola TaxID=2759707 RepID=A0A7G5IEG3_9SPHN|nr:hypothetical protein [Sandaracinobacteroides saxicola]QMW21755.1 hypothetical protein H3309_10110 [Sandaracinobacteroides saxicola]